MPAIATTPDQLARALRDRRLELGWSQRTLADATGLGQKTVSELETTPERRSVTTLFRALAVLGLELEVRLRPGPPSEDDPHAW